MLKNFYCALLGIVVLAGFALPGTVKGDEKSSMKEGSSMTSEEAAKHWEQGLAKCLLLGNQEEVLMGEFASERAQSDDVRQFAQQMVKKHNEAIAKLERYAPGAMDTEALGKRVESARSDWKSGKESMPVSSESEDNSKKTGSSSNKNSEKNRGQTDFQHPMHAMSAIQQQMAENCIAIAQSELSQLDKDQFDRAYMSQQICAHVMTLAKLKTLQAYAPADLKPLIESEEKTTRSHLDEAKKICKRLESKSETSAGKRND
jgi:predicted outer membrane protein